MLRGRFGHGLGRPSFAPAAARHSAGPTVFRVRVRLGLWVWTSAVFGEELGVLGIRVSNLKHEGLRLQVNRV